MKIIKVILEGNVRLLYAGIRRIEYTPESVYQLIVGTNGSGKSSLIAECSPLPGARQDYVAGGSKYIEVISDDGKLYQLTSDFKLGNRHTFVVDGEILNDAGTGATQKELVKQHLNYDSALHQLITGELKFTQMGPQQRREWISKACRTDVTYGLSLYNKLKTALRDCVGARKHAETRLAVEYNGLYTEDEFKALEGKIAELTERLTSLMYAVDKDTPSRADAAAELEAVLSQLRELSETKVLGVDYSALRGVGGVDVLEGRLRECESQLHFVSASLAEKRREYTDVEDTLQQLAALAQNGSNDLTAELDQLKKDLLSYCDDRVEFDYGEQDFVYLYKLAEELDHAITDKLLALPPNPGKRYNTESLTQAQQQHDHYVTERNIKTTEHSRLSMRKETILSAERSTCPSCGYVWVPGVSEQDLSVIDSKIALLEQQLTELTEKQKANQAWLEEIINWRNVFSDFRRFLSANPALLTLGKIFVEQDRIYEDPVSCTHVFYRWKDQLARLAERSTVEHRIDELTVVLKRAGEIAGGDNTSILTERAVAVADKIRELTQSEQNLRVQRDELAKELSLAHELERVGGLLESTLRKAEDRLRTLLKAQVNDQYRQLITRGQAELAQLTFQLSERRSARDIVTALENQRAELLCKEDDYQILVDEISPTSGLIADQLAECIGALVEQMNAFIANVWTYDLAILPCGLDGGDLDYRFPLEIKRRPKTVADVSKGSGAQKAIVDFVFVLVYLAFTDLKGYPIFPDELGATFDPEHRIRLVEYFKQLCESKRVSQVFYISHNAEAHDVLVNADRVVMDATNLKAVTGANRVIQITRGAH